MKINTDGAWPRDSNRAGYAGVSQGSFLGAFAYDLTIPSSVDAEVMAVMKVIELTS